MEDKVIGIALLAGLGIWLWSKRKVEVVAAPPPTITPPPITPAQVSTEKLVTDPTEITVALNTLGVPPTLQSLDVKEQLSKMTAAGIDYSKGIPEDAFLEYFQKPAAEAIGLTMAEIPTYAAIADETNKRLGGYYVAGVLYAPDWWTGSITEWSRHVQQVALIEYNRLLTG